MKLLICVLISSMFLLACASQPAEQAQEVAQPQTMQAEQDAMPVATQTPDLEPNSEEQTATIETAPQIVKTAVIANGEHGVSATINLYSDNTLEITGFNYDGKAPDTYVTVGNKTEDGFEKVALVSDKITVAQENTSLKITLEEGLDYNAVSIYCSIFAEDFGSAILEDAQ